MRGRSDQEVREEVRRGVSDEWSGGEVEVLHNTAV